MNDIYIDVGPHKTATTWRQRVLYPVMDIRDHRHCFLDGKVQFIDGNDAILSDETLYGWCYLPLHDSVHERRNALRNLTRWFPGASVIVCRREIEPWKHSLYKQYIWAGGSDTFEGWLSRLDDKVFDIDGYIARLQDAFEDVLVLDFELLKRDHRAFSQCICDFVGVPLPEYENRQLNVSLSDRQMKLLRQLNKLWWTHERKGIPGFRLWRELLYLLSTG